MKIGIQKCFGWLCSSTARVSPWSYGEIYFPMTLSFSKDISCTDSGIVSISSYITTAARQERTLRIGARMKKVLVEIKENSFSLCSSKWKAMWCRYSPSTLKWKRKEAECDFPFSCLYYQGKGDCFRSSTTYTVEKEREGKDNKKSKAKQLLCSGLFQVKF